MARTPNRAELRGHALKTQSGAGLVSLFFGKQGELRGRSFDDQLRSFSCLGVLHNAVVAWNIIRVGRLVEQLRAEGHTIDDATLALTTPLMHKHLNPFGRYQFDLARMRQTGGGSR